MNKLCTFPDCPKLPNFGIEGTRVGLRCAAHKEHGMIDVKTRKCAEEGCSTIPVFAMAGAKTAIYCVRHMHDGMVDIRTKRCAEPGCEISASYGEPNERPSWCASHRSQSMIDLRRKFCSEPNCPRRANYGLVGTSVVQKCFQHRDETMIDVRNSLCVEEGCSKRATFGEPGLSRGLRCAAHKTPSMINVKSRKCAAPGCQTSPGYGFPEDRVKVRCARHVEEGMIAIESRQCEVPGCTAIPRFGLVNTNKQIRCQEHREEGMLNIYAKICRVEGCGKRASYGQRDGTTAVCCSGHHEPDMIDVKNKHCAAPGCMKIVWIGLPGRPPTVCRDHLVPGMIRFPLRKCVVCKLPALFGMTSIPEHCEASRLPGERNLVEGHCANCSLEYPLNENKLCEPCSRFATVVAPQRLVKQAAVVNFLRDKFAELILSVDSIVDLSCSRKRPDIVIDAGPGYRVIVEIDEHQHSPYECGCEIKRMLELHGAFGGLGVTFIRFNPDRYAVDGKIVDTPAETRLERKVQALLKRGPTAPLTVLYLYYDEFKVRSVTEKELSIAM